MGLGCVKDSPSFPLNGKKMRRIEVLIYHLESRLFLRDGTTMPLHWLNFRLLQVKSWFSNKHKELNISLLIKGGKKSHNNFIVL